MLAGWVFDVAALKSVHPSLVSMKANTAACFVLAGWALWIESRPRELGIARGRVAQACAAVVAIVGAATMGASVVGTGRREVGQVRGVLA